MLHLVEQGGVPEHILEYLQDYSEVRLGEFDKAERDLLAVVVKRSVERERKAIKLYSHLADQPKLRRYEPSIQAYTEKIREETRLVL